MRLVPQSSSQLVRRSVAVWLVGLFLLQAFAFALPVSERPHGTVYCPLQKTWVPALDQTEKVSIDIGDYCLTGTAKQTWLSKRDLAALHYRNAHSTAELEDRLFASISAHPQRHHKDGFPERRDERISTAASDHARTHSESGRGIALNAIADLCPRSVGDRHRSISLSRHDAHIHVSALLDGDLTHRGPPTI